MYRGVPLVYLPTWRHKYFDTIVHTFFSTIHLIFHRADAALYCNGANAIFTLPAALARHSDAAERGWPGAQAQEMESAGEGLVCGFGMAGDVLPDRGDYRRAADRKRIIWSAMGSEREFIPYGAETGKVATAEVLAQLGLEAGGYFLYVSRMEPENNALLVREAFERVVTPVKLALIGDAPYAQEYIERVRDTRDPRVVMPGAIYGAGYHELLSNCLAYIHATEVGGTHPALIEAMGAGRSGAVFEYSGERRGRGRARELRLRPEI